MLLLLEVHGIGNALIVQVPATEPRCGSNEVFSVSHLSKSYLKRNPRKL